MDKINELTVNEFMQVEDIDSWKPGDIITISAGLGSGKSYFIRNKLYDYARERGERILMLIHRKNCVTQFQHIIDEENKTDVIDIETYQQLENGKRKVELSKYDYIVCDEHHYFFSDAGFNNRCDLSIERILGAEQAIRIFMSATGDLVNRYFKNLRDIEAIEYEMPISYDYINSLTFYNQDKTIEDIIDNTIEKGEKAIAFVNDIERGLDIHRKYKPDSLFNCGGKKRKQYVNTDKIETMLIKERFEESLLVTTSVMEAGVSITDTDVTTIILEIEDLRVLIQCLGRRRISDEIPNDKIDVYIRDMSREKLEGRRDRAAKNLMLSNYLIEHGEVKFAMKYGRELDNITTYLGNHDDGSLKVGVNYMARFKQKIDISEAVLAKSKKHGYKDYVKEAFGLDSYNMQEKMYEDAKLEKYLRRRENDIMLSVKDRSELIEMVNVRNRNNRLVRGINTINDALIESDIPFRIIQFETNRYIDGKRKRYNSAWKIVSTE